MISDEQMPEVLAAIRSKAWSRRRWRQLLLTCGRCGDVVGECYATDPRAVLFPTPGGHGWAHLEDGDGLLIAHCRCGEHHLFTKSMRARIENGEAEVTNIPRGYAAPPQGLTGDALVAWISENSNQRIRRSGRRRKH